MALEGLKEYEERWENREPPKKREYKDIPDGRYQARIDKASVDQAKSTGADMLCLELVIINGKFKNRRLFRKSTLSTPEQIDWLGKDLDKIEVEITPIYKIDEQLDKFLGVVVEVYIKNKEYQGKNYPNVYFNKRLHIEIPSEQTGNDSGEGAMYEEVPSAGDNDECPF